MTCLQYKTYRTLKCLDRILTCHWPTVTVSLEANVHCQSEIIIKIRTVIGDDLMLHPRNDRRTNWPSYCVCRAVVRSQDAFQRSCTAVDRHALPDGWHLIVGMPSIIDDFEIISASEYCALCLRKYFLATLASISFLSMVNCANSAMWFQLGRCFHEHCRNLGAWHSQLPQCQSE